MFDNIGNQISDLITYNKTATAIVAVVSFLLGAIFF